MEGQLINPLAATHLLQHTLRSLCSLHPDNSSQWVYAVFWRILPRNYPPPKWDCHGGAYDRSRGNRRNWILVWEDGYCNFGASVAEINVNGSSGDCSCGSSSVYGNCEYQQYHQLGLQPELFFKMSHEVYNFGEGLIGKVAADHSHKWIFNEPNEQETNFLSVWQNSADSHPRTWEAQFRSGIKTIALIAVREGVVQLGSLHKVIEDLSYIVLLRKKFNYIESIPGVLLPHPSSCSPTSSSFKINGYGTPESWHFHVNPHPPPMELSRDDFKQNVSKRITPSMSSLEALLSKLPEVVPPPPSPVSVAYREADQPPEYHVSTNTAFEIMRMERVAKEEIDDDKDMGESSSNIISSYSQNPNFNYLSHHDQWILKGDP